MVQPNARKKIGTDHKDGESLGSVDNATIALRIVRLIMAPYSEARFAKKQFSTAVVVSFLLLFLDIKGNTFLICSNCRGDKCLPPNRSELPPHLIKVETLEVALGDRYHIRLVFS